MSHSLDDDNSRSFPATLKNPSGRSASAPDHADEGGRTGRPESGRRPDDAGCHEGDDALTLCRLAPPGVPNATYALLCEHGSRHAEFIAPDDARAITMAQAAVGSHRLVCEHSFGEAAKAAHVKLQKLGYGRHMETFSILALREALRPFIDPEETEPVDLFRFAMDAMFFASDVRWREPEILAHELYEITVRAGDSAARKLSLLVLGESSPHGPGITLMNHDVRIHTIRHNDLTIGGVTRMTVSYRRGPRWLQELASFGWSAELLPVPISKEVEGRLNLRAVDAKILTGAFECLHDLTEHGARRTAATAEVDGVRVDLAPHPDTALLRPASSLPRA